MGVPLLTSASAPDQAATSFQAGRRNLVDNGAMMIVQKGTSIAIAAGGSTQTLDRWNVDANGSGAVTVTRPNDGSNGFPYYLRVTVTTPDSSVTGNDYYMVRQAIEGVNVAHLMWGTPAAVPITISFWVRTSVPGTYSVTVRNVGAGGARGYPVTFTSLTGNWEYKTVTVPGETSGTWVTDTTAATVWLWWSFGMGTTYAATERVWTAANVIGATGITNLISTNGATFDLTGVQVEAGTVATPFERRSYADELRACQRYFQRWQQPPLRGASGSATVAYRMAMALPVVMRAKPTPTISGAGALGISDTGGAVTVSSIGSDFCSTSVCELDFNTTSGLTASRPAYMYQGGSGYIDLDASI